MTEKTVKIVVLGDIGRSPRMQYHALSLANNGLKVKIIGYVDSSPLPEVLESPKITVTKLHPLIFNKGPRLLQYALKAFWQALSLLLTLLITGKCHYLLCQNPPAIPTLPICRFYCLCTKTQFIIDWHNYAYSIMALSLPPHSLLLRISTHIERYFGQSSQLNFCVTYAMKEDLCINWNVVAKVLYDRPPKIFRPITLEEKHAWFLKLSQQYTEFGSTDRDQLNYPSGDAETQTAFTQVISNQVEMRAQRPGLLFSSTSWTPDEDFGVLLEALQDPQHKRLLMARKIKELLEDVPESLESVYDQMHSIIISFSTNKQKNVYIYSMYEMTYGLTKKLPKLICVITGKGPMKQHYIDLIVSRKWQNVKVLTPWLEACDYPAMVASADLGVCLHTSSSGLDLPMKVVDMFGAGLPVCAYDFKCLSELVEDGTNGYIFKSSNELITQIVRWFEDFPNNDNQNRIAEKMRSNLNTFQESRWEENWNLRVRNFFV